ncbi:MAG TPA: FAD-dependent oxidoreductase, partial [Streptosporangiaceae bacterium]|nr:FAD-dependent oxidoreductase [Streptosporangiaceae bacterium]
QQRGLAPRRPSLPASTEADVCIVGGGYTGLWTAYYLTRAEPGLHVVVVEQAFAGFGASGRNGGWVSAALPGSRSRYAEGSRGTEGVRALEQALRDTVDEVGRVCEDEGIDAGYVKGGVLTVARSAAQGARLRDKFDRDRAWGDGADVVSYLDRDALAARMNVTDAVGALYSPHCARIQPARLVADLAEAVVRSGVELYEATPVTALAPGQVSTAFGTVRARYVLRCTEGFTSRLPGLRRKLLPMNSTMIVTEPLSDAIWDQIGWGGCELLGDEAHAYMYAQRTADGRIAIGGRGIPYRYASGLDDRGTVAPATVMQLTEILHAMFPATASAGIAHAWCGVLGVPRDWCASVTLDRATGLGYAGGYSGHGVAASNLAGRTLADLVRGARSELVTLPWVGHRWRSWEPEPLRWTGVHSLYTLYRAADRLETRAGKPATSPLARMGDLISGIPH